MGIRAHHSEPTDSELLEWLTHTVDSILGLGPLVMVVLIGVVVVLIPLTIAVLALRRRGERQA
ncbi:MAG: hypothetical protein OXE50_03420 [Chloroflexi bacterium]|nr:hypothetical protein [Chloroflexota bacterium]